MATQQPAASTHLTFEDCEAAARCLAKAELLSQSPQVLNGLWVALAALTGVFVGALIPFAPRMKPSRKSHDCPIARWPWATIVATGIAVGLALTAFILTRSHETLVPLYAAGALFGGLLVGLFIPAPGQGD